MLKALSPAELIVVDRNPEALKLAEAIGADHGVVADGTQVDQVLALTGGNGGKLRPLVDHWLNVSASRESCRIQETHILIGHVICQLVDAALYGGKKK